MEELVTRFPAGERRIGERHEAAVGGGEECGFVGLGPRNDGAFQTRYGVAAPHHEQAEPVGGLLQHRRELEEERERDGGADPDRRHFAVTCPSFFLRRRVGGEIDGGGDFAAAGVQRHGLFQQKIVGGDDAGGAAAETVELAAEQRPRGVFLPHVVVEIQHVPMAAEQERGFERRGEEREKFVFDHEVFRPAGRAAETAEQRGGG